MRTRLYDSDSCKCSPPCRDAPEGCSKPVWGRDTLGPCRDGLACRNPSWPCRDGLGPCRVVDDLYSDDACPMPPAPVPDRDKEQMKKDIQALKNKLATIKTEIMLMTLPLVLFLIIIPFLLWYYCVFETTLTLILIAAILVFYVVFLVVSLAL